MIKINRIQVKFVLFFTVLGTTLLSCTNTRDKLISEINAKEKVLFENKEGHINTSAARETIVLYRYFAEKFPDDSLAVEYLFKAGDVSSGISSFDNALEYFKIITEKYPNSNRAAYSLFLQGYINENSKQDTATARKFYTQFLEKYPTNEMAESARFSLSNMGKSPEEIVRGFQPSSADSVQTTK